MIEEYHSIMKNYVWKIVPRPEGKIYTIKNVVDGSIKKYKAWFMTRGFS